jgi:hypothetical protein
VSSEPWGGASALMPAPGSYGVRSHFLNTTEGSDTLNRAHGGERFAQKTPLGSGAGKERDMGCPRVQCSADSPVVPALKPA